MLMRAWASMGSPRVVPVPCASTTSMSLWVRWALVRAWVMGCCCAWPLGAGSPLVGPSWLMAVARMMAWMGWLFCWAVESFSMRRMPIPSDQAVPFALSEKGLQCPSGASPCWRLNSRKMPGVDMMVALPVMARVHSLLLMAWQARWRATSEEEQAVSMVMA